jgi:hypothetical protein
MSDRCLTPNPKCAAGTRCQLCWAVQSSNAFEKNHGQSSVHADEGCFPWSVGIETGNRQVSDRVCFDCWLATIFLKGYKE